MTGKDPSYQTVSARLTEIELLIEGLEDPGTASASDLREDRRTRHLAERELSQVVEIAASISVHIVGAMRGRAPESYHDSFRELARLGTIDDQPSTGLRNILVHEHLAVDFDRVAASIPLAIEQYSEYVRQVAAWMDEFLEQRGP